MSKIINKDIEAIHLLVKEIVSLTKTHQHNYDRTYASVIKNLNTNGTYTIQDTDGVTRNVKCALPNAALNKGQGVWVKIPAGRLEDMHICGIK